MSRKKNLINTLAATIAVILILSLGLAPVSTEAASHREAPTIALDPTADITDFFFFRSYEPGKDQNVVLIMDVIPGEEPSAGPNYWNFDPNVLYKFSIDNNGNGTADNVAFEIQFTNEFRGVNNDLGLFLSYVAVPPITALDGEGSEGLGMRQRYTVTMVRNGQRTEIGEGLIAVPSNVGPRTMPDYAALAAQGIYDLEVEDQTVRVFAGQRDDPFYIDLGALFDTLNLRRSPLPLLTAEEDANDKANAFGIDMLGGYNVHTIALEVPVSLLTGDGEGPDSTSMPVLGAYASTSRRRVTVLDENSTNFGQRSSNNEQWVQIQRLANPLVNEAIIGTADKDRWNMEEPVQERRFLDYYLNPRLATALELVFEVPASKMDRTDLVNLLLKYKPDDSRLAELLRLNVSVPPTPFNAQKRLGPLAGDPGSWPNGRRPMDDVTDIAVRVIGGQNYIDGRAGDGINTNDKALSESFPFLAAPFDGVNRVHPNP